MPCFRGCCPTQAAHFRSLSLSSNQAPSRARRHLDRDLDAYARLRRHGLQPRTPEGAYRLEATARTPAQVETRPEITDLREFAS